MPAEMTLNLMLTSRSAVYLTGDFRLTHLPSGKSRDDLDVQKLIPIFRHGWSALVSYTGIARTPNNREVGDWIAEHLQAIEMNAPFTELSMVLLGANDWLRRVRGYRQLTFCVVGFIARRPVAMVLSNFQDFEGNLFNPPLSELRQFEFRPKTPQVFAAGDRTAVLSEDKSNLKRLLIRNEEPRAIHSALASINAAASQRSAGISRECVTGHLLPSGSAEVTAHNIKDGKEYIPGFVKRHLLANGIYGHACKRDLTGKPLPPTWRGMTAKVQGRGKKSVVAVIHCIGNVGEPLSFGSPRGSQVFWKVAEKDEPKRATFKLNYE